MNDQTESTLQAKRSLEPYDETLKRYTRHPELGVDTHLCERCRNIDFLAISLIDVRGLELTGVTVSRLGSFDSSPTEVCCESCDLCGLILGGLYDDDHSDEGEGGDIDGSEDDESSEDDEEEDEDEDEDEDQASKRNRVMLKLAPSRRLQVFSTDRARSHSELVFVPHNPLQNRQEAKQSTDLAQVNYKFLAAQIKACIDTCESTSSPTSSAMPKNLIDCTTLRVRPAQKDMEYIALSYVWGIDAPEAEVDQQGKLRELPQTIADAVTVTLSLGKQYLWVDRYCIDQKDQKAKIDQINNMGNIYAGAWTTIVSLTAHIKDGLPGVSTQRPVLPVIHTTQGSIFRMDSTPVTNSMLKTSSWSTRGWTYQEAALSQRLLVFTHEQAYVMCDKTITEERQSWLAGFEHNGNVKTRTKSDVLGFGASWEGLKIFKSFQQYVRRDLSFETDSLTAFRGYLSLCRLPSYWGVLVLPMGSRDKVAAHPHRMEEGFMSMLLWYHQSSKVAKVVSSIPSWSWASQRRSVTFATAYGRYMIPVGSDSVLNIIATVLLPLGDAGELVSLTDLVQTPHLTGPLSEHSRVLGIKSRIHTYTMGEERRIRTRIAFTDPSLCSADSPRYHLYLYSDRRPPYPYPLHTPATSGKAVFLRFSEFPVYGELEAYWLAFEYVDEKAHIVRRTGLIRMYIPSRDHPAAEKVTEELERDWREGEHTLLKFV